MVDLLKEEYYIRTKEDEFVLKAVEAGEQYNKYTATLNVEELCIDINSFLQGINLALTPIC